MHDTQAPLLRNCTEQSPSRFIPAFSLACSVLWKTDFYWLHYPGSLAFWILVVFAQWAAPTENQGVGGKKDLGITSLCFLPRDCSFGGTFYHSWPQLLSHGPLSYRYDSYQVLLTAPLPSLSGLRIGIAPSISVPVGSLKPYPHVCKKFLSLDFLQVPVSVPAISCQNPDTGS